MRKPTDPDARICQGPKSCQGYIFQGIRELSFVIEESQALHSLVVGRVDYIIREVD